MGALEKDVILPWPCHAQFGFPVDQIMLAENAKVAGLQVLDDTVREIAGILERKVSQVLTVVSIHT